mgnify:CR=1 FL=1
MKHSLWVLLLLIPLSGCTSFATWWVAEEACSRENVYCGDNRKEERDAPEELAAEAFKYDKKIYSKVTGKPTEPEDSESTIKEVIYCEDNEEKVCISTGECTCF